MAVEVLLSALGALLSTLAAAISLSRLIRKRGAVHKLEVRFAHQITGEGGRPRARKIAKLQSLAASLAHDPYDEKAAHEAIATIEAIAHTMDASDREQILSALRQPSHAGRIAYAQKVIKESADTAARTLETATA